MAATIQVREGDGSSYTGNSVDGRRASGEIRVHVVDATDRSDAIAAVESAYPTHPDDASLPFRGSAATFAGFYDCTKTVWRVVLVFGFPDSEPIGNTGRMWYHMDGRTMDDHGTITVKYRNMADVQAAMTQAAADYPTHPNFASSPPLVSVDAVETNQTSTGYDVTVRLVYSRTPFDLRAYIASLSEPTSSDYAIVSSVNEPVKLYTDPVKAREILAVAPVGNYPSTQQKLAGGLYGPPKIFAYTLPSQRIQIYTRTSSAPTGYTLNGYQTVTANGTTYTNARLVSVTSVPVEVDTGLGLDVQFDNTYVYHWAKKITESVDEYDPAVKNLVEITAVISDYS